MQRGEGWKGGWRYWRGEEGGDEGGREGDGGVCLLGIRWSLSMIFVRKDPGV